MKSIFSFILISSILFGCKKYPDGPLISLRSKEHRLTGEWQVEYFSINGYDSTTYLQNKPECGKYFFGDNEEGAGKYFQYRASNGFSGASGFWEFKNNKKDVSIRCRFFDCDTAVSKIGAYGKLNVTWKIQRLKDKELWLKTNYAGKEYFVKFFH